LFFVIVDNLPETYGKPLRELIEEDESIKKNKIFPSIKENPLEDPLNSL